MTQIEKAIVEFLQSVAGDFGFVAWHLGRDEKIMINEHAVFPSASVIKVPLMVELFCQRDEGKLALDEMLTLKDDEKVDGSGALKELHGGTQLTLLDLISLMIVVSDNTATNMLINRIGVDCVNERIKGFGLENTILARKMYNWEAAKAGKENRCTAHDLASLLKLMCEGQISSKLTSMEMVDIMARQQYREKIPLLLPEGTRIANKTGSLTGVTHDVGIVYGPAGPYLFCILTKDVSDVPKAERTIAEVSRIVYGHFCS